MEQFIAILIKLLAAVLCGGTVFLIQEAVVYIRSKMSEQNAAYLDMLITELCQAARCV